jgi:hypothetical protein
MVEPTYGQFAGLPALRRLADQVRDWPEQARDWQWCARFGYQVIERRGTGGGNFRAMYARFLDQAGYTEPARRAALASACWTALADGLREASEQQRPEPRTWERIGELTHKVLQAEDRLWRRLAEQEPGQPAVSVARARPA